jgi:hypothetical protein
MAILIGAFATFGPQFDARRSDTGVLASRHLAQLEKSTRLGIDPELAQFTMWTDQSVRKQREG